MRENDKTDQNDLILLRISDMLMTHLKVTDNWIIMVNKLHL